MRCPLSVAVVLLFAGAASAGLGPDEIAIIAMRRSPQSVQVATHYAQARGIPESHICLLDGPPGANLTRREWETSTRPAIRRWLARHELETKIRCMVTVWDVPLRIRSQEPNSPELIQRRAYLEGERQIRFDQFSDLIIAMDALLPAEEPADRAPEGAAANVRALTERFDAALNAARQRIRAVHDSPRGKNAAEELEKVFATASGPNGIVKTLTNEGLQLKLTTERSLRLAELRGQIQGLQAAYEAIEQLPESVERDQQILAIVQKASGLVGTLQWIEQQLGLLDGNETYASFDSELSLLFWPRYPLLRWRPNVLHHSYDETDERWHKFTLMVSRLEAPTFELTLQLIDTAIETEKEGLSGKVYLDARGIKGRGVQGGRYEYDESLRRLASLLKQYTEREVLLDDREEVFQPGACPDAALYCGWYSLAHYVDAFDWQPGAVGYHMASGEAHTLRDPESNVWCKRMLEDGVCATIGPVEEPYLEAFPRPEEFFGLLLSGRYTLAECYYRTKPFNSWVMVLVGDPLYNPYRHNPQWTGDDVPPRLRHLFNEDPGASSP